MSNQAPALFVLEDGTHTYGTAFGARGTAFGEAVFNTGMTGYQEVLTDPSYRRQIVAMTVPHVGNYGMNDADQESDRIQVAGFIVREVARRPSSWRSQQDLASALDDAGVVGISGVDTRWITRHLRDRGAMRSAVSTDILEVDALVEQVQASPSMQGAELASEVTTATPYVVEPDGEARFDVALIDFGTKRSIAHRLNAIGARVHVLPASATADDVRALRPDGVMLSNGPGDPAAITQGVATVADLLGDIPLFGICFGSQLLGRALGGTTYKLRFGHRGVNQPVMRRRDGVVEITSHNHGFALQAQSLGEEVGDYRYRTANHGIVEVSHINLNDDVCEGIEADEVRAFSVQYHPEAAPGPHDARYLFDRFAHLMQGGALAEGAH